MNGTSHESGRCHVTVLQTNKICKALEINK